MNPNALWRLVTSMWWLAFSALLGGLGKLLEQWQSPLGGWIKASGVVVLVVGLLAWLFTSGLRAEASGDGGSGFDDGNGDAGDSGGADGGD